MQASPDTTEMLGPATTSIFILLLNAFFPPPM